jgi:hypothetical protein
VSVWDSEARDALLNGTGLTIVLTQSLMIRILLYGFNVLFQTDLRIANI